MRNEVAVNIVKRFSKAKSFIKSVFDATSKNLKEVALTSVVDVYCSLYNSKIEENLKEIILKIVEDEVEDVITKAAITKCKEELEKVFVSIICESFIQALTGYVLEASRLAKTAIESFYKTPKNLPWNHFMNQFKDKFVSINKKLLIVGKVVDQLDVDQMSRSVDIFIASKADFNEEEELKNIENIKNIKKNSKSTQEKSKGIQHAIDMHINAIDIDCEEMLMEFSSKNGSYLELRPELK